MTSQLARTTDRAMDAAIAALDLAPGAARALRILVDASGMDMDMDAPELDGVRRFIAAAEVVSEHLALGELVGATVEAEAVVLPAAHVPPRGQALQRDVAKLQGYEGEACQSCMNFTLVRNGTCLKCNTCGSTSGCS